MDGSPAVNGSARIACRSRGPSRGVQARPRASHRSVPSRCSKCRKPEANCLRACVNPPTGWACPRDSNCAGYPERECVRRQLTQLAKRGKDGEPGVCHRCYTFEGVCIVCGRFRAGAHSKRVGGAALCAPGRCVDASMRRLQTRQEGRSHHLAIGPFCSPCYSRRRRNPEPCSLCGVTRVRGGLNDDGGKTCGPGCGTDIVFSCRRCGTPGDILGDGRCLECGASDRVHNLLADEDGQVTPALAPLAEAPATAPSPRYVLA